MFTRAMHLSRRAQLRRVAAILLLSLLLLPLGHAQAATISVCATGGQYAGIQAAVDAAQPGDVITVCPGVYVENVVIRKNLTLQGADKATTILDGGRHGPVVIVGPGAWVTLAGLTIANGKAEISEEGGWGVGGGVRNEGRLTLDGVIVRDNSAYEGGGVANYGTVLLVYDSEFVANHAEMGGALTNRSSGFTHIVDSRVAGNEANPALFEWDHDDAGAGGGLYNNIGAVLIVERTLIEDNEAWRGGGLTNGEGFDASSRVNVVESTIRNNRAQFGGGIHNYGRVDVVNSTINDNLAVGRPDSDEGMGGGILSYNFLNVTDSTVSGNRATAFGGGADGGRGGGVFNGGQAALTHATVAYNHAGGAGSGIYAANWSSGDQAVTSLSNNIIARNEPATDCGGDASYVFYAYSNLDSDGSCRPDPSSGGVTADPLLGPLADNGGPTFTHALRAGSPALDAAPYCLLDTDQRNVLRPQGNACDLGAFEAEAEEPPPGAPLVYLSTGVSGSAGGLSFGDEDIVAYAPSTGTWAKYFDGSDLGLQSNDLDAFEFLPGGDILMSFSADAQLPGITGTVADEDIVEFVPTTLGEQTAGTFAWYLDGSDVGLAERGSDVDAIATTAEGALAVSTRADVNRPGLAFKDEDLVQLAAPIFGESSGGSWSPFFDGSDVGLDGGNDEDLKGAWIDPAGAAIHLTTLGNFSVPGVTGTASDILACAPGSTGADTICTFSLFWQGADHGFTLPIDGLQVGGGVEIAAAGDAGVPEPAAADEEALDDDLEEEMEVEGSTGATIFLPAIGN